MSLETQPGSPELRAVDAQWAWKAVHRHRGLLIVLAAGLLVRVALLVASASMPLQIADEQHYAQIASSLAHRGEFAFSPGELTSMRPPLYPAFVASLWALAGHDDPQVVRTAQVVLGLFVVVLTYALALRQFGRRAAVAAAAVVCFYPSLLYAGVLVLTEIVFTVLMLLFVLLFTATLDRPRLATAMAMGMVLGGAALTRSVLWPLPVLLFPFLCVVCPGSLRRRVALAAACVIGFAFVVGPWAVRNTRLHHTLTIVDTMGGMNLRMGNYEHTPEDRMWDAVALTGERGWSYPLHDRPEARAWTVGQKDKWAQREALAYMVANPGTTLRRSLLKFADFWGLEREMIAALAAGLYAPPRWFTWLAIAAVVIAYPLVALSAVMGVWGVAPTDRRTHILIVGLVLFVTAIHSVVFGHSRYHLPLVPFLALYAAAAWASHGWRERLASPRRALAPAAAVIVLILIWSHELLFRDINRVRTLLQALS